MGDYLKEAYLLAAINKNIDDDFQKLSDKLENLRLSHNRKRFALENLRKCFLDMFNPFTPDLEVVNVKLSAGDVIKLLKICEDALFCDGRVNSRRIGKPKKKGGK